MYRAKVAVSFLLVCLVSATAGFAYADVVHLSSGQSLIDVQVLSKSWRGYDVQITGNVTVFFARDEVVDLELDRIEPLRSARRKKRPSTDPDTLQGKATGDEVSPDMSARLQQPVNVNFENTEITEIVKFLTDVYGVPVILDPALFEPGGLTDTRWSVDFEDAQFIKVINQLALDKGLQYSIVGDTIRVFRTKPPPVPGGQIP